MAQGQLGGLVGISGVKPQWWQGQLDLPCGPICPRGPIVTLLSCYRTVDFLMDSSLRKLYSTEGEPPSSH